MQRNDDNESDYWEEEMGQFTVQRTDFAQMKSTIESEAVQTTSEAANESVDITEKKKTGKGKRIFSFLKKCRNRRVSTNSQNVVETEAAIFAPASLSASIAGSSGITNQQQEQSIVEDLDDFENFDALQNELKKMKIEKEKLIKEMQIKDKLIKEITHENWKSSIVNEDIRDDLITKHDEIEELSKKRENLDRFLNAKIRAIETLQTKIDYLNGELKSKQKMIDILEFEATFESMPPELGARLYDLRIENDYLREERARYKEEIGRVRRQLEQTNAELRQYKDKTTSDEYKPSMATTSRVPMSEKLMVAQSGSSKTKNQLDEVLLKTHQMEPETSQTTQAAGNMVELEEEQNLPNEPKDENDPRYFI